MSGNKAENHRNQSLFKIVNTVLFLALVIMVLVSKDSLGSNDDYLSWNQARGDLSNTGYILGNGNLIDEIIIQEIITGGDFGTLPVCLDIENDSTIELIFTDVNKSVYLRNGPLDGTPPSIITTIKNVVVAPMTFDFREDGTKDLIFINISNNQSWIHFISGHDFSTLKTVSIDGHVNADGKIFDVDSDGHDELIISIYSGKVYSIDLSTFETDWTSTVTFGLREPVAVIIVDGSPKIVVTTGISFEGWEKIGSKSIYVLNGVDGLLEWSFETGEEIIATPPSILKLSEDSIYIVVGNYAGSVIIIDYRNDRIHKTIGWQELNVAPYWKFINIIIEDGQGRTLIAPQGERCQLVYDFNLDQVLWKKYQKWPEDVYDSLCCDIDGDDEVEFLYLIGKSTAESSKFIISDLVTGDREYEIQDLPSFPIGFIISDVENDGFHEICLIFRDRIICLNRDDYIIIDDILIDGKSLNNLKNLTLYSMYKNYTILFDANISLSSDFIKEIIILVDPDDVRLIYTLFPMTNSSQFDPRDLFQVINLEFTTNDDNIIFQFDINWSFPHEHYFRISLSIELFNGFSEEFILDNLFRVENDITISGDLELRRNHTKVPPTTWFHPNNSLEVRGLLITYENSTGRYVNVSYFEISLFFLNNQLPLSIVTGKVIVFILDLSELTTGQYSVIIQFVKYPKESQALPYSFHINVDSEPLQIINYYPKGEGWISSQNVTLGIVITDTNGSGINHSTLQIKLDFIDQFNTTLRWNSPSAIIQLGGNLTLVQYSNSYRNGIYRYQWKGTDNANNPMMYSQIIELQIDIIEITFEEFYPTGWINQTEFETGIMILYGSPFTSEYSKIQYSQWNYPNYSQEWFDSSIEEISKSVSKTKLSRVYNEGLNNFIQWRVFINDSISYYSNVFQLLLDITPPIIFDIYPDLKSIFEDGDVSIHFKTKDDLSGIDSSIIEYKYRVNKESTFRPWQTCDFQIGDGYYECIIMLHNLSGKDNNLFIKISDIAGNTYENSEAFQLLINEPPSIERIFPLNGSRFRKGESIHFTVECSDPDFSDILNITWTSSIDGYIGSGKDFTIQNLSIGTHEIILMVIDGSGHSVSKSTILHIETDESPVENNEASPYIILLLFTILFSITGASLYWLRKRNNK